MEPEPGTVPMIYPAHCRGHFVAWPVSNGKKPNAIIPDEQVKKWLYRNGHFTVVRRFSSKEERRRVVASIYDPASIPGARVAFENHLNVFHCGRQGLSKAVARGLAVYLNSTFYDICFRQFSGHTQVNVKDLLNLRYPDLAMLETLGERIEGFVFPSQSEIDSWIEEALF
jgi:adenine-specific DNA-methyltransferase